MAAKKVLETEKCCGQEIDLLDYTHIRAYHACRPENVQLYTDIGLIPYDEASALNDALQKLLGGNISEAKIREQFNKMWENSDAYQRSVVWLALEKSELLGASCHYLIYGSEFLNAMSMHLGCREKLKNIGRPTIVVCDIPIRDISRTWLDGLEESIADGWASMRSLAVPSVAPQDIIDFIYPTSWVDDPYTGMRYKLSSK